MTRWTLSTLALLLALVSGCATTAKQDAAARSIVAAYLEAERAGRYDEAWGLLAPTDRATHPVDAYIKDHANAGVVWQTVASRTTFELGDVVYAPDHQVVEVIATRPDPEALTKLTKGVSPESLARSRDPKALMRAHLERTLDTTAIPPDEETLYYGVQGTEDGRMYVWLGLDRQFTAIQLAAEARRAQARGDNDAAIAAWNKVRQVPPDPTGTVLMLADEAVRQIETLQARATVVTPESLGLADPVAEEPATEAGPAADGEPPSP